MIYNVAEYVIVWHFNGLHDGKKLHIYFKPFSYGPPIRRSNRRTHTRTTRTPIRRSNGRTHTRTTRTPINAIGKNVNVLLTQFPTTL